MIERIIVIVGMPRSGTSWLSQIVDSSPEVRFRLSPLFSYAFKNAVDEHSTREAYRAVFEGAYAADDRFMDQTDRREAGQYPVFADKAPSPPVLAIKMTRFHHLLPRMLALFEELQVVAIVRHPCGAIHSWLTTPKEFPSDSDPMTEWRTGACRKTGPEEFWGFDDWMEVTRLHLRLADQYPERCAIVRYEELVASPGVVTGRLFDFLGLAVSPQTEAFLESSRSRHDEDTHSVFKDPAVADRWRTGLDPSIRETIESELAGTELERFLA